MKRSLDMGFFRRNEPAAAGPGGETAGKISLSGARTRKNWSNQDPADPDLAIVDAFLAGNDDAFIRLYAKYEVSLFYYCKRMLHSVPAAEDVFQESWARMFELR